jgi:hypothetical protein
MLVVGAPEVNATPVKTLVQDTLYRADGSVAHGSVMLRWNAFSTGAGEAIAAGQMTVTTDTNGAISIPLIPNTGTTPSGSYYKVVIKLDDGTTSEETWVVPVAATTTVAAIRATVVSSTAAAQFVSRDYLDSALAALSPTLVHVSGAETIQGAKTFVVSPEVPAPTDAGSAANKGYVDQGIAGLAGVNLAAPGAIGSTTPGPVNATSLTAVALSAAIVNGEQVVGKGANVDFPTTVANAAMSGGSVYLPAGTYTLSGPLNISNVEVWGDAEKTIITMGSGYTNQGFLNLGSNVHLHHLTINAPTVITGGNTILAANTGSTHVEIDHVRITGSGYNGSQGVALNVAGIADWNIHDNTFINSEWGVLVDPLARDMRGLKVYGNDFGSCGEAVELNLPIQGMGYNGTPYVTGWNTIIANNTIHDPIGTAGFGVGMAGAAYVSVTGNTIASQLEAIHIEDNSGSINVAGNVISSTNGDACMEIIGGTNISVTDNIMRNCTGPGINFTDSGTTSVGNFTITGNQISNASQQGIAISEHSSTSPFVVTAHGIVSDNLVTNNGGDGIVMMDSVQGVDVTNNSIYDNAGCGIDIQHAGLFSTYKGNVFGNNAGGIDYCYPTTNVGGIVHVEDVRESYINAVTVAAGGTANAATISLGNSAEGDLTVLASGNSTGSIGYYAQRTFHVRWNGTTFESIGKSEINTSGPVAVSGLSYSSGVVQVAVYQNFGSSQTFNVNLTFIGSIQGGFGTVSQPTDYTSYGDNSTINLASLPRGKAFRYSLSGTYGGSTSAIINGLIGETYYGEICQAAAGGGTFSWPVTTIGFPTGSGMVGGSCARFPFTFDGTNYVAGYYQPNTFSSVTLTQLGSPGAPAVSNIGTAGATTYTYACAASDGLNLTLPSAGTSTTTGNATLSGSNYNQVTCPFLAGLVVNMNIYRTAGGTAQGLIGTVPNNGTLNDTGLTASGSVPASNSTGILKAFAYRFGSGATMYAVHGSVGNIQLSDGTGASGDVARFDGNGNVTDGGVAASKILANCGTMTTTAAASNTLSCSWVTTASNCTVTPNNSAAVAWTYYVPTAGTVTVYHASTAGATYAIACSVN